MTMSHIHIQVSWPNYLPCCIFTKSNTPTVLDETLASVGNKLRPPGSLCCVIGWPASFRLVTYLCQATRMRVSEACLNVFLLTVLGFPAAEAEWKSIHNFCSVRNFNNFVTCWAVPHTLIHQSVAGMTCSVGLFVSEKVRLTSTHLLSLQNVYIVKFTSY